jgi:hypothetical protein
MYSIYKYPLELTGIQTIKVPEDSRFLCLKEQNDIPVTYWEVDTKQTRSKYCIFYIFGTGNPLENMQNLHYIDTVICNNGMLVWHIYCKTNLRHHGDVLAIM